MEETLISVIAPTYNAEKTIGRCLESILRSSWENLEVIVVNDGSEDHTLREIEKIKDPRVRVYDRPHSGLSLTRNYGMETATGDYITFVDSDDWISPDMLQKLAILAEKEQADIAICNHYEVRESDLFNAGKTGRELMRFTGDGIKRYLRMFMLKEYPEYKPYFPMGQTWATIYRKALLDKHRLQFIPEMDYKEDVIFSLYAVHYSNTIIRTDEPLYYYNKLNAQSMTTALFRSNMIPRIELDFRERERFCKTCGNEDALLMEGLRQHIVRTFIRQIIPATWTDGQWKKCKAILARPEIREAFEKVNANYLSTGDRRAVGFIRHRMAMPYYLARRFRYEQIHAANKM